MEGFFIMLVIVFVLWMITNTPDAQPRYNSGVSTRTRKKRLTRRQKAYQVWLRSPKWKALAGQAKARDGYKCKQCGSTQHLHAHHLRYPRVWDDTILSDLVTLCRKCHKRQHRH